LLFTRTQRVAADAAATENLQSWRHRIALISEHAYSFLLCAVSSAIHQVLVGCTICQRDAAAPADRISVTGVLENNEEDLTN